MRRGKLRALVALVVLIGATLVGMTSAQADWAWPHWVCSMHATDAVDGAGQCDAVWNTTQARDQANALAADAKANGHLAIMEGFSSANFSLSSTLIVQYWRWSVPCSTTNPRADGEFHIANVDKTVRDLTDNNYAGSTFGLAHGMSSVASWAEASGWGSHCKNFLFPRGYCYCNYGPDYIAGDWQLLNNGCYWYTMPSTVLTGIALDNNVNDVFQDNESDDNSWPCNP